MTCFSEDQRIIFIFCFYIFIFFMFCCLCVSYILSFFCWGHFPWFQACCPYSPDRVCPTWLYSVSKTATKLWPIRVNAVFKQLPANVSFGPHITLLWYCGTLSINPHVPPPSRQCHRRRMALSTFAGALTLHDCNLRLTLTPAGARTFRRLVWI